MLRLGSLVTAASCLLLSALSNCSTLTPPVLPLVVRTPYLSTWLANARDPPWTSWPMFWTGQHIGFSVMASVCSNTGGRRVDCQAYALLGRPQDSVPDDVSYPIYVGAQYDASTTNLTYKIPSPDSDSEPAKLTLSFLSPITPTSTLRQAIPAAYMTIFVEGSFDISVYVDLNGQWVSGDRGSKMTWQLREAPLDGDSPGLRTWSFQRETELEFSEYLDRAEWGTLHFSAPTDVQFECGAAFALRPHFAFFGTLRNQFDGNFRGIMEREPVFAFSKTFKLNGTSPSSISQDSVTFTIAHTQEHSIQYAASRGLTLMRPLWASYFSTQELLTFHYLDHITACSLATKYSAQLAIDAFESGAADYVDIVALSARQVMGAVTFVGIPDDPAIFLKEISSNGNTQTIDVLFPAFPFFLYSNPQWLAYLLEPLIEHMLSGQYPNKYAMHDIGTHFPNATGYPYGGDEYMPVEECGDILIMGLALVNSFRFQNANAAGLFNVSEQVETPRSADSSTSKVFTLDFAADPGVRYIDAPYSEGQAQKKAEKWVNHSYRLWKQWTGYLVEYSLRPENQLSTDDFAGWLALQTNLALKGIIGIRAMSKLAEVAGNDADAKMYNNISQVYITKWMEYGLSRDKTHAKVAYDWYGSWTTLYNLYADSLLCFRLEAEDSMQQTALESLTGDQTPLQDSHGSHKDRTTSFIPKSIYTLQSTWYYNVRQKYGLPLDSRHLYTKTDWEFFAMAVSARSVREPILQSVANWVNMTNTDRPFTDLHDTEGQGGFPGPNFFARPVVGGHFAFLALKEACGGRAREGLRFLDDDDDENKKEEEEGALKLDVEELLRIDLLDGMAAVVGPGDGREDL